MMSKPATIDEYIAGFPKEVQAILQEVREVIKTVAPDAEEVISYGIPTFRYKKAILVHFAGFKNHLGFYALPSGNAGFQSEISSYKTGKGSIQFPLDKAMPTSLIEKIVKFRVEEVEAKGSKT